MTTESQPLSMRDRFNRLADGATRALGSIQATQAEVEAHDRELRGLVADGTGSRAGARPEGAAGS